MSTITRRKTLTLLSGAVLTTSVVGIGGLVATRQPKRALAPWGSAGEYDDPRLFALSYAVLAPNPHNRQPWLVDIDSAKDTVIVYRDLTRDLPATDPFARQLTVGLGCFLELMSIAASQQGFSINFEFFPQGEDGPVANAKFVPGASPDLLFDQILHRRSCKEPYENRPVPKEFHRHLMAFGDLITDQERVRELQQLSVDAWKTETKTPSAHKESVDLMRFGRSEINNNPDGINIGGGVLELLILAGALTAESQNNEASYMYQEGVRRFQKVLLSTPAYMVLTTAGNSRIDQIEAGRRWLRLNLTTTALGLALHPVSQALQEFPEMKPHYEHAHRLLAQPGYTVQMLGRLGFGPVVPPSPRWAIETRILHG